MIRTSAIAPNATTTTEPALSCHDLVRSFGDRRAVDGVSFSVAPGETYGLLGPNGAGKSTTIKMVCGLLRPDAGTVWVAGHQVGSGRRDAGVQRLLGYVPQDVALYPDLSARENLAFFGRLYGLGGTELRERVAHVLDLVGLTERAGDRLESFSGGMRRRLNIAAGLVHRPTLLVLDEPTVGVDPQSRHAILEAVHGFGAEGMAVLYTTHYMEEAERLCDRVGIIDHGRLVAEGSPRQLVRLVAEHDRVWITFTGDPVRFLVACRTLPNVLQADVADGQVQLLVDDARRLLPSLLAAAEHTETVVRGVQVVEPDLESVFLHLTGTALRE